MTTFRDQEGNFYQIPDDELQRYKVEGELPEGTDLAGGEVSGAGAAAHNYPAPAAHNYPSPAYNYQHPAAYNYAAAAYNYQHGAAYAWPAPGAAPAGAYNYPRPADNYQGAPAYNYEQPTPGPAYNYEPGPGRGGGQA
jgi:hypothetical protein